MGDANRLEDRWAVILGASSGFGAAIARALAKEGMHICGVHLDSRSTLERAQQVVRDINACGRKAMFFNTNAADERKRTRVLNALKAELSAEGSNYPYQNVHVLVHTLAFGSLRLYIDEDKSQAVAESHMDMTMRVMANSLVWWAQDILRAGLFTPGSRIFSMSSLGSRRATPYYGPVSAAKAALEAHTRQLAVEMAPHGVLVNALMPGVSDTPASRVIPNHERIKARLLELHPAGRLTEPEDVADTVVVLSDPRLTWISGAVIPVDGAESVMGKL